MFGSGTLSKLIVSNQTTSFFNVPGLFSIVTFKFFHFVSKLLSTSDTFVFKYSMLLLLIIIEKNGLQIHNYLFLKVIITETIFQCMTISPKNPNLNLLENFENAVRYNNRGVAAAIAKEALDKGDVESFNTLHYEVYLLLY